MGEATTRLRHCQIEQRLPFSFNGSFTFPSPTLIIRIQPHLATPSPFPDIAGRMWLDRIIEVWSPTCKRVAPLTPILVGVSGPTPAKARK